MSHLFSLLCISFVLTGGKCPFMFNSAAEDAQVKVDQFAGCACDYREGAPKKESSVPAGL